jgi:ribosomal-protein-alanine N-acetyltransferase
LDGGESVSHETNLAKWRRPASRSLAARLSASMILTIIEAGRLCSYGVKGGGGIGSETTSRLRLSMPEVQLLRLDHAPAVLAFEQENRAYFAASVPDRGNEFFAEFEARYAQLLEWQAAGTDYLHVLVADGGEVVGRVNLIEVADGSAELGYRIARKAAGQGLATAAVREVRELAAAGYGLTRLRARITLDNPASRKVLERNGFVADGELTLDGKPATSYVCELC